MDISAREVECRKAFLALTAEDEELLTDIRDLAREYADPVIEDFYRHLLSFDETAAFFSDPRTLEHVKRMQKEYFLRLTDGEYDENYVENRLSIGKIHERVGLPVKAYLGMYNFYLRAVANRLAEAYDTTDPERGRAIFHSLMKHAGRGPGDRRELGGDRPLAHRRRDARDERTRARRAHARAATTAEAPFHLGISSRHCGASRNRRRHRLLHREALPAPGPGGQAA